MDSIRGIVERITFHNDENGYTIAKLTPERPAAHGVSRSFGRAAEMTIVGNMAGISVGENVEIQGRWSLHPTYGKQFTVEKMRTVLPATVAGIEKYLGSGLIKGVGPVTAKRIVAHFGVETLQVIDEDPGRLAEVPGVGAKRTRMIIQAWEEQRAIKEVMIFLQSHGVSTSLATKIYKTYGDEAVNVVRNDPYRLARDIFGIGFLTADKIARSLGIPGDSPLRVAAGAAYTLNQATEQGHVYLPTQELLAQAAELLEVSAQQVGVGLQRLWADDQIKVAEGPGGQGIDPLADSVPQLVAESGQFYAAGTVEQAQQLATPGNAVYLTPLYYSEVGVAGRISRLVAAPQSRLTTFQANRIDWGRAFTALASATGLQLAPQQRQAVKAALTHRLTVLTGGPGTGKTTTVDSILRLCQHANHKVLLAAPTGRAAKRLTETTGQEAKTIHRLLEFQPSEGIAFKRDDESPLEADLLIVDEASMLDLVLTNHLLKAIPPGMHLLLVGDVDQLPSVGAGNVLKDIIAAIEMQTWAGTPSAHNAIVIRLETIFRQAAGSHIISNAHRINQGRFPFIDNQNATDFFHFRTDDAERAAELCVELVQTRIPRRFGFPAQDIQVLSPMHRGAVGVGALNEAMQQALNPPDPKRPERRIGNRAYRQGDRVMQIRNNYDKDVYNGDMGSIQAVDLIMQTVTVAFDDRSIVYDFLELDELIHAFAISVHKSQGSEFPVVVIPVMTTHYMMLQRNLLYTAVTRARRLVVLVGQRKAINIAIGNNKVIERFSGLCERLTGESIH